MHEQSVIRALLKQVDAIRLEHGSPRVTEIRVEVGPLSGVEPLLLASAFEQLSPAASPTAELVIDEVALTARCKSCHHEFDPIGYIFRCPICGDNVQVIRGEDIQLVSVSMQTDEPVNEGTPAEDIVT